MKLFNAVSSEDGKETYLNVLRVPRNLVAAEKFGVQFHG